MKLFHLKTEGMMGPLLRSLNGLKQFDPVAFNFHDMKYDDRRWLPTRRVPGTNKVWADFIQLTAIDPRITADAMKLIKEEFRGQFYVIDPAALDPKLTRVFLWREDIDIDHPFLPSEFVDFHLADLEQYAKIPKVTQEYYDEFLFEEVDDANVVAEDEVFVEAKLAATIRKVRPQGVVKPYLHTAHILYSGIIDITHCALINV